MLPDYEMLCYNFPREDVTIIPVYDVHLGAREYMEQEFQSFLKMVEKTPNVYLVLGGDLINNATRSSVSNIFDETCRPSDQKKQMVKLLEPVRDRILCSVTGNHERRSGKDADDDPVYDIMCKLDIEDKHRENVAFLKIQLGNRERENGTVTASNQRPTYTIAVTHGSGGGIYTSSAVLKGERFAYTIDGLDCLIVGHTHKPFTVQGGKLCIDSQNNKITMKPFKVVSATSWVEYGGYAVQKMLLPSSHCLHTLTLRGSKKEMVVTM